jgi:hypothetical protein
MSREKERDNLIEKKRSEKKERVPKKLGFRSSFSFLYRIYGQGSSG